MVIMFCDWLNSLRLMVIMFCDWLNSLRLMVIVFCDWLNSIRLMVIMFCDWLNSLGLMVLMLCDSHELCSFFYISIYLHLLYILISIYIDQFYCWRKPEDPEKTTYLSQVTDRHDITEILLIVALNTIKPN